MSLLRFYRYHNDVARGRGGDVAGNCDRHPIRGGAIFLVSSSFENQQWRLVYHVTDAVITCKVCNSLSL